MDCREQEGHHFQPGSLCGVWGAAPVLGKQLWGTAGDFELKTKSHQPRNPLHESGKEEHIYHRRSIKPECDGVSDTLLRDCKDRKQPHPLCGRTQTTHHTRPKAKSNSPCSKEA